MVRCRSRCEASRGTRENAQRRKRPLNVSDEADCLGELSERQAAVCDLVEKAREERWPSRSG